MDFLHAEVVNHDLKAGSVAVESAFFVVRSMDYRTGCYDIPIKGKQKVRSKNISYVLVTKMTRQLIYSIFVYL